MLQARIRLRRCARPPSGWGGHAHDGWGRLGRIEATVRTRIGLRMAYACRKGKDINDRRRFTDERQASERGKRASYCRWNGKDPRTDGERVLGPGTGGSAARRQGRLAHDDGQRGDDVADVCKTDVGDEMRLGRAAAGVGSAASGCFVSTRIGVLTHVPGCLYRHGFEQLFSFDSSTAARSCAHPPSSVRQPRPFLRSAGLTHPRIFYSFNHTFRICTNVARTAIHIAQARSTQSITLKQVGLFPPAVCRHFHAHPLSIFSQCTRHSCS